MTRRVAVTPVRRRSGHDIDGDQDLVAVESPLALAVRRPGDAAVVRLGLLMRTPCDDEDLVAGFLFTEGIIREAHDLVDVAVTHGGPRGEADAALVTLRPDLEWDPARLDRGAVATSACGLCGRLEMLAVEDGRACPAGRPAITSALVESLPDRLARGQNAFAETGGLHAAALVAVDGARELIREDVGRHNAVDKVLGAALARGWLPGHDLLLAVSGRVAYEIVHKAVTAGLPAVAAVGAPSSLAVEAGRAAGLTVIGFVRGARFNVYAGWERLAGGTGEFPAGGP
jgi:FdhD protein